jgi:nicotinate-nucleotide adenylyltransferase
VFGGTFNPIHLGHLRSAVELVEQLDLHELRLMPSGVPPHREAPAASAAQRAHMIELAIAGEPRLCCDRRELDRDGPSYTLHSLQSLRAELGERAALVLAVGADALLGLPRWYRWTELLDHCHIVALARPGWEWPEAGELADYLRPRRCELEALRAAPAGCISLVRLRQLPISSTEIRRLVQSGASIRYLVPDPVRDFIEQHQCYQQ